MSEEDRQHKEKNKKRITNLRFFLALIIAAINIAAILFIIKLVLSRLSDFQPFLK